MNTQNSAFIPFVFQEEVCLLNVPQSRVKLISDHCVSLCLPILKLKFGHTCLCFVHSIIDLFEIVTGENAFRFTHSFHATDLHQHFAPLA